MKGRLWYHHHWDSIGDEDEDDDKDDDVLKFEA